MGVRYTTREKVKASLEISHTARANRLIDPKLDAATFSVENQMHRRFYPELKTVKFDWPNYQYSPSWRLWLGDNELITKTDMVLTSGGVVINNNDVILRRADGKQEPPYTYLELLTSSTAAFGGGSTTQEDISLYGLYGYRNDETPAGDLAANINSSVTTVDINPLNNALLVETGSLIKIGTERMITTDRRMVDTTINTAGTLDDLASAVTLAVTDGSGFGIDEVILIDSERMRIVDIAGNNLTVERQFDGTVLAEHSSGADVYALRRYTVQRGVLGTTAASHTSGDDVSVFVFPGLIDELATAEAIVMLEQATGAYAQTSGAGESGREVSGTGLPELQKRAWVAHARKARTSAI